MRCGPAWRLRCEGGGCGIIGRDGEPRRWEHGESKVGRSKVVKSKTTTPAVFDFTTFDLPTFDPHFACNPAMTTSRNSRARLASASTPSGLSGRGTSGAKMFSHDSDIARPVNATG